MRKRSLERRLRVVAQGTPAQLRGDDADRLRLELVVADEALTSRVVDDVTSLVEVATVPVVTGRRLAVPIRPEAASTALAWAQRERESGRIEEFSASPVSLEDVYIRLTSRDNDDRGGASCGIGCVATGCSCGGTCSGCGAPCR